MKNKIHTLRIFLIALILVLSSTLVSAGDFNIYNRSDMTQTYFAINGTTGNIGIGISDPTTLLQLLNNRWISALNNLTTGAVNMFKVNENDAIELGATLNIGSFEFNEDSGLVTFVDMPVSSTPSAGTSESYVFKVDGDNIMTVYSEADGSGGVQNKRVGIGTITPQNTLNVIGVGNFTGNLYGGTVYSGGSAVLTSYTETDPYWTGNQSLVYLKSNPFAFINTTTASNLNYLILSKWANITDAPTTLSFFTDDLGDRSYTHLTNFTDDLGNRGYTHLTNFTDDILWTTGFNATGDSRWLGIGEESDPLWTANQSSYFTKSDILGFSYYNLTSFDIADYYLKSNPFSFYNSTTDGAGSGLDADLLDGSEKAAFQMDVSDSCSGENVIQTIAQDGTTGCYDTYSAADDLIGTIGEWQDQCTNCVTDGDVVDTLTASNYVRKSTWTDIDDYPTGCSAGQAVRVIGDTLTCIDVENATILEGYSASFFMPLNTSVVGNFSFNGGWTEGGLSIIEGDIYAQQLFVYNISHINVSVSHLNINGSLLPWEGFDNQFDIGASDRRWRDLHIGRNASIGGDLSLTGTMTSGTVPWARLSDHSYIIAGTGLEGGGDLSINRTLSLTDTGVSAGGYGSTTINYPRFTVDAQGRITSAANQTIRTATTSVSGITTLTASVTSTSNTTASTPWGVKVAYDTAAAKASPGTCPVGQVVQNTTTGGVQCVDVDKASAVNGTGTQNTIAKFTGTTTIGDSKITDDGTIVAVDTSDLYINTTSGNVGIGTTAPKERLDLGAGTLLTTQATVVEVRLKNTGLEMTNIYTPAEGWARGLLKYKNSTGTDYFQFGAKGTGQTFEYAYLGPAWDDTWTVWKDGKVGIGTTSPESQLHLAGTTGSMVHLQWNNTVGPVAGGIRSSDMGGVDWGTLLFDTGSLGFTTGGTTDANIRMIIRATGNVGIGTTSPYSNLEVGADETQVIFSDDGNLNRFIAFDIRGAGTQFISVDDSGELAFGEKDYSNDTTLKNEWMRFDALGNVGIGTTSPGAKLHILQAASDVGSGLRLSKGAGTLDAWAISVGADNDLHFGYGATPQTAQVEIENAGNFLINTGNVGIGTTSPKDNLHIDQSSWGSQIFGVGSFDGFGEAPYIGFNAFETASAGVWDTVHASYDGGIITTTVSNTDTLTRMRFGFVDQADASESTAMTIRKDGNVGIGTTSPFGLFANTAYNPLIGGVGVAIKAINWEAASSGYAMSLNQSSTATYAHGLVIHSAATATTNYPFRVRSGATDRFVVRGDGNVGIGVTDPDAQLEIESTGDGDDVLHISGGANQPKIALFERDGGDAVWSGGLNNDLIIRSLANAQGEGIHLQDDAGVTGLFMEGDGGQSYSGNVGIGTTSPGAKLDVSFPSGSPDGAKSIAWFQQAGGVSGQLLISSIRDGTYLVGRRTSLQSYAGDKSTPSDLLLQPSGGNVGIGTTSPDNLLHVNTSNAAQIARFMRGGGTAQARVQIGNDDNSFWFGIDNSENFKISPAVDINTDTTFIIQRGGNVGIGTITPQQRLHVNGSAVINGTLNMDSNKIISLGNGTSAQDAITLSQLQAVNESAVAEETDPLWTGNWTGLTANRLATTDASKNLASTITLANIVSSISDVSGSTGTTNLVLSASPTFTGTVTIPSPFTLGATSVTTTGARLNYLTSAGGTTGTTSTNLVFSTSPTITSPTISTSINLPSNAVDAAGEIANDIITNAHFAHSTDWGDVATDGSGLVQIESGVIGTAEITDGAIAEVDLKIVDVASDEDVLTYEITTGDFEWHSASEIVTAGGGITSESDPLWTANQSSYYTKTNIDDFTLSHWTDDLGNRGYTHLTNFTDNLGDRGYTHLTNFTDNLGDRGYTHLTNFTDDILWTSGFNATGDSRWLTSFTETDPKWTGNFSSKTGTGNVVFSTSPTLTTPNIGAATAGGTLNMNNNAITNINWAGSDDGSGSELDADKLDGQHGSYYQDADNLNAGIVPSARLSQTQNFYVTDPRLPATNQVHSTLSGPTIAELSIPSSPYVENKLQFIVPIIHEYTENGVDWNTTSYTDTQLKKWVAGRAMGGNLQIPSPNQGEWEAVRFTFQAPSYVFLNWLYLYTTTSGHQLSVKIEKSNGTDPDTWFQVAQTNNWSSWPGHQSIPHTTITWNPTNEAQSKYVRLTFYSAYNPSYPANILTLYNINWYGYYPANPQTDTWYWDEDNNFYIKENLNIGAIAAGAADYDKFLVSDSGLVKYRTGTQVRADIGAGTGDGTVTSVGLSLPSEITVTGSPVTTSGTLTGTWATQTQNKVFAAPSGSTGTPTFRTLIAADIPNLDTSKITTGTFADERIASAATWNAKAPTASPTFTGSVTIPSTADDATYTGIVTNDGGVLKYRTKAQILSDIGAGTGDGTVTSVAAGNGMDFTTITGSGSVTMGTPGTLGKTSTNALTATSHTHDIADDYVINTGDTMTGDLTITTGDQLHTDFIGGLGSQLGIGAGEMEGTLETNLGTSEIIWLGAEGGVKIVSSPDNMVSGWAGRHEATLVNSGGDSTFPGDISATGALSGTTLNTGQGAFELYGRLADLVAGTGIGGGGNDVLYGLDGDVNLNFDCSEVEGTGINCAGEAITLDATGDWTGTLDSIEGASFLRSDADDNIGGDLTLSGGAHIYRNVNSVVSMATPIESWSGGSGHTGAIYFVLPNSFLSTMMTLEFDGYVYTGDGAWKVIIGGYTYKPAGDGYWVNYNCQKFGSYRPQVRLGSRISDNRPVIIFGDDATVWSYPKITLTRAIFGHGAQTSYLGDWESGTTTTVTTLFDGLLTPSDKSYVAYATTAGGAPPSGTASGDLGGSYPGPSVDNTKCTTADQYLGGDGVCYGEYDAGDDLIGTIGEWDTACTDCVGNDDIAAGAVDLTSDALSTAYAGVGIGGGGTAALSFAAADVDGTCLTGSGTTLNVDSNCIDAATVDSLSASDFLRSNLDDSLTAAIVVPTGNRDEGIFGTYDSAKTQHIWSMGTAYRNSPTGASFGNLYGLAYKYNGYAGSHGVYLVINGVEKVGLGTNLWVDGDVLMTEDDYIGISGAERIEFNGGSGRLEIQGAHLDLNNNDIFGVDKITANEIDPVYTIGGARYATYVASIAGGLKEEVTGIVRLNSTYIIDFKNLEVGSDLWLFYQITDFGSDMEKLQVFLTPSFNGNVWYNKNPSEKTLTISGDQKGEVSYRFIANRFDWTNRGNLYLEDNDVTGLIVPLK